MKFAIDARGAFLYHGTGIGTYTNNIISEMLNIKTNDEFTLFCSGKINEEFNKKNSKIFFSSGKHSGFYEKYYFQNILKNNAIDLYHIPQNGIGFNINSNVPTVVTIHDLIPYVMPETVGKSYLKNFLHDMPDIIANAHGIITVSEFSKRDILKYFSFYPQEKIFVTPLATNSIFKPLDKVFCKTYVSSTFTVSDPYILYIGGFSSRKNAFGLIKAFLNVYSSLNKKYKLVLAGSLKDEGQKLLDFVKQKNAQDKIIFTGFVEDNVLPILYSGCDAFVYPSFYEGFGLPPLEAMSCKAPVITSSISSIPEVTKNSALLINPNKNYELESALTKLLNDENLKKELSEKGFKRSLDFNWGKTALNTLKAYKEILKLNTR